MYVKKMINGEYLLINNPITGKNNHAGKHVKKIERQWFLVRNHPQGWNVGQIHSKITCPPELIGCKVQITVKVIQNAPTNK